MSIAFLQIIIFSIIIFFVLRPDTSSSSILFERDLFSFAARIRSMVILAIVLLLVIEAVCVYIVRSVVINPITKVVAELNKIDPFSRIHLQETYIKEIDQLTCSIENMSVAVADSASRISKIIDIAQIPIGVFEYEEAGSRVFCSSKLVSILGWDKSEYIDSYYNRDAFFKNLTSLEKYVYNITGNTTVYKIPQGKESKWIQITILEEASGTIGTITDISRAMEEKIRIEFERDYDVLTGIFNRRAFDAALDNLFEFPSRIGIGAFVMFDLDNLKYVNDTYGHEAGDNYIKTMAKVLKGFEEFNGIISRRSGDEFNVFLYGYRSKEQVRDIVFAVYKRIEEQSILLPNQKAYTLMASAGVAYYPDDADNVKLLTTYSDFAMYLIKHSSKGNIKEFNLQDYKDRSYLITGYEALVRLLDRGELEYAMQPIFDVAHGIVYGYEMLMRSNIQELSSPMEILSMAKSQSKLYLLERTTWFNALATFAVKAKAANLEKNCKVFFNSFGSLILHDDDLYDFTSKYEDYLSSIVLELIETERHIVEFSEAKAKIIKDFGGMIALDNFGSGYNNEALLVISSPHLIKVDRAIISNIDEDKGKQQLLKNIISYAKTRNIKIVAEGVETQAEMETVVSFGVDYLQGYYIGQPEMNIVPISEQVIQEIKTARERWSPV
jgi:diguanylate cyclase (GGDEF)-like protein